jgi:hypothetical protein
MFILKRKVVRRLSESTSQIKTKLILAEQRTSVNNSERQMKRKNKTNLQNKGSIPLSCITADGTMVRSYCSNYC